MAIVSIFQFLVLPLAVVISLMLWTHGASAQTLDVPTQGDEEGPPTAIPEEEGGEAVPEPPEYASGTIGTVDPETTSGVVASISAATRFCQALPATYRVDCMAERLAQIAQRIRNEPGMAAASEALMDASQALNRVAWANMSTTQDARRFRDETTQTRSSRALIPVSESRVGSALAQADAILSQTETTLLRSAEGTADRAVQYQRIATAINSNKVLLRS